MEQEPALPRILLGELTAGQARFAKALDGLSFSKPQRPCVPDPTFKTWALPYVASIAGVFLARLDWNLRAVALLCREGLAVQAQPILRACLESAIDLRYISSNPQTLVTKWCIFEEVERYRYWKDRPEYERPADFGYCMKVVTERLRLLDRHAPRKNGTPWTLKELARDWDLSNLARRDAAALKSLGSGEESLYGIYKLLSGNLHGGTESAQDFIVAIGDGQFRTVRGVPGRKTIFVPWAGLQCLATTVSAARRCGAVMDEGVGPHWDTLGVGPAALAAAASADFKIEGAG